MKFIAQTAIALLLLSCSQETEHSLPDPVQAGWEGESVCEVLEENDEMRVFRCVFAPGVGHEKHYHPPHFGYTVKGSKFRISDSTGVREVNVPSGYSFSKEVESVHEVQNIGSDTAVFLIYEWK